MNTPTLRQLIEPRSPTRPLTRLVLCEQQNDWAIAIVRAQRRLRPVLCETRSLCQMSDALELSPRSFLGIELTATNFESILTTLINISRNYPQAVAVILSSRHLRRYEAVLRQAGAIDFLVSTRRLPTLLEMINRHFNLHAPVPSSSAQSVWQRLPWQPRRDTTDAGNVRQ